MGLYKYLIIPFGLSFIAGIIYLYTAAPSMAWLDALNHVTASATFGVSLPPTPLYIFLGHFFTLLPFGSVIFRLQIFSVLLASASLFFLYQIIVWTGDRISDSKVNERSIIFSGIFGILALAFSYQFWSQAQNTDKWILQCLLELLVLYLITVVLTSRKKAFPLMYAVFFLLGLSTGTDPVVLSFFPSVLFVLWERRRELNIQRLFLLGLTALAGVVLIYSYLPIASARDPFLNWGRPTTFAAIWDVATGQGQNSSTNGFTGSAEAFFTSSWRFISMLWMSFTPFLLPFMLLGGWYLWKMQKRMFWLLFLIILTNFILSGLYLSGNQESWYLLPDVSFAIFAGMGYLWLTRKLQKHWYMLFLLLISLAPLFYWWTALDRHAWRITDDYVHNLYGPIKEPAILFGGAEPFVAYSYYVHDVIKYKPNVIPVLNKVFYIYEPYRENLNATTQILIPDISKYYPLSADNYSAFVNDFFAMNLPKYKVYIDYPAHNTMFPELPRLDGTASFRLDTNRFKLIPAGLAEEVVPKDSNEQPNLHDFNYQFSNGFPDKKPTIIERVNKGQLERMILQYVFSYITIGDFVLKEERANQAEDFYQKAYAMDPHNGGVLSKLASFYLMQNQPAKALVYFREGYKNYPNDTIWLYSIALTEGMLGNINEERTLLEQVISETQNNPQLIEEANNMLNKIKTNTEIK